MKENFPIRYGTNVSSSTSSAPAPPPGQLGLSLISLSAIFACYIDDPLLSRSFLMAMLGLSLAATSFCSPTCCTATTNWRTRGWGTFRCELKKYRQLKGLTQEQLGELVGVRRETIMRLEAGKYNPSLKLAVDISRAVEAPIEEIFLFD